MCEVLEVSRSGYYARCKRPPSARKQENDQLKEQIQQIHQATRLTVRLEFTLHYNKGALELDDRL
jgi:hypothetical protein